MVNKVIHGDCLEVLKTFPDNCVDSICCDPPYELGFMGKSWDNTGIANNKEMWAECLRVLKPGGHLLAFSGTRTYHRMAVAIEDAGFEVRDMVEWVYGSGFPKSLNIGKAVDKLQGNEREVIGKILQPGSTNKRIAMGNGWQEEPDLTKGTSEWEGWGTALKPAHESIMLAQKPLTSVPLFDKIDIDLIIKKILCLLASNVKTAESNLVLSQHGLSEELNIAQWIAEKNTNTQDALSVLTDMLLSESKENTNLNIVILWLNILEDLYQLQNKFTTLTEISLTIELKILESLEWENIFQSIIQAKDKTTDGKNVNVLTAVNLFNAVRLKLNHILTHFAQDPAILKDEYSDIRPKHEPICMARKPLGEKTVAENCLKYGTGGINIDESRVELNGEKTPTGSGKIDSWREKEERSDRQQRIQTFTSEQGRFPANLIHDNSEEVRECFPNESERFFKSIIYQAKASKSERNEGCEGLETQEKFTAGNYSQSPTCKDCDLTLNGTNNHSKCSGEVYYKEMESKNTKNNHPTVKPLALMEYLIKMVTPKGGIVLDPFAGSGSTLVAAKRNGYQFIGIELTEEYLPIIEARLNSVKQQILI